MHRYRGRTVARSEMRVVSHRGQRFSTLVPAEVVISSTTETPRSRRLSHRATGSPMRICVWFGTLLSQE